MRHMNSTTCILGSVDLMFAMQRAGQCKRDKMHAGVRLLLLGMSPTNKCSLSNVSSVTMLFVAYLNAFWLVIFLPGKPKEANSKSTRCQCQAMIRLLRTDDEGWYINEFREQADDDVRKTMAIFSEMKAQDSEFTYNVQSVLYAGVLMRDETEDTFKWIFDEFVKMTGGKKPITIVTDQARAMEKAIEEVYPESTHRWCKWHVLKKAKENLGAHYTKKSDFRAEFHKLVHEMLTIDEFEDGWAALLDKYSLKTNPYLVQIYETRQKWARPYFAGKFCARQTSTSRSESANHMLKQYVPPSCSMNLFVKQ
uniref:Protein FAR1-RELATED SEQUENCE n=1 Tax=Triticum urartu TaxID=4572 RepID=A0A8R7QK94_TRIUA